MITVISYGSGNIKAFVNLYKTMGIKIKIAENINDLIDAEKIIIPGVGSYDETIKLLNKSGMRQKLDFYAKDKKIPILGVCVGMQIMGESSEEGVEKGLGWIRGKVKKLPKKICHRLPHMGWNNVIKLKDAEILKNVHQETKFYFLHSYYFETEAIEEVLAKTSYNFEFNSIINDQNIYGIQFHPEKSHSGGYSILKNFSEI